MSLRELAAEKRRHSFLPYWKLIRGTVPSGILIDFRLTGTRMEDHNPKPMSTEATARLRLFLL